MIISQPTSPSPIASRIAGYESTRIIHMHLGDLTDYHAEGSDETRPAPAHNDNELQKPPSGLPGRTLVTAGIVV